MAGIKRVILAGLAVMVAAALFSCPAYAKAPEEDALKKAVEHTRSGNNDLAIAEFAIAIKMNPASFDAYYNRGFVYYKQGKYTEAIADFTKAINLNPASADSYYNRGLAYYKKGSFDEAIADYNKVMELNPGVTDALYGRGLAYFKKNDIKQAITDYNTVIEMRPEFPLVYSARAIAYFSKKDYGKTLADVNKAISLGFRSRPLKEVSPAAIAATEVLLEKSQPAKLTRDPKREAAWRAKRRLARIKTYLLYFSLLLCLAVILLLIRKNRTI